MTVTSQVNTVEGEFMPKSSCGVSSSLMTCVSFELNGYGRASQHSCERCASANYVDMPKLTEASSQVLLVSDLAGMVVARSFQRRSNRNTGPAKTSFNSPPSHSIDGML